METTLALVLDAILALLIFVLFLIVFKRFVLTPPRHAVPASAIDGAQELLEQRAELKDERASLRKQFFAGELDKHHFRAALTHNNHELALAERQLKKIGFG
jgi:hypothetical protein